MRGPDRYRSEIRAVAESDSSLIAKVVQGDREADFNQDGCVDLYDLAALLAVYRTSCP